MPEIIEGKRYTSGVVSVKVKQIRNDIMVLDYNMGWTPLVVCDTPTMERDVGLPLTDMQDHFEEDVQ